ncbi:TIGR00341 family protein [Halomarina rubra]|uniref:TIGR00341 family protein n=1 Tax=Halomarina rubra TaxID=2071873 RepID=A0ABD6AXF2_9EURY|nr:TIGR00341 family protein [Halomarina rubra]
MRLIQVRVTDESRESVLDVLDNANADYVIADEAAGNDASIVYFPTPAGAVKEMLDDLSDAGLADDAFTIVTEIETATTPHFDELEGRYTQGPEDEIGLSHAELRTKAQELTPETPMFVVFAALSAILATAGLLLDSAIVIVGAMVVAPFAGSSLSASVGIVSGNVQSVATSVRSQLLGLAVAMISATFAAAVFRWGFLVPPSLAISEIGQVAAFTTPTIPTLTIAVVAGAAGALALSTDLPVAIAGVAVAAAVVPAAAAVGIGLVWVEPLSALGGLALLLVNVVFINISALVSLFGFGYRPSNLGGFSETLSLSPQTIISALATVALVALVVAVLFSTYQFFLFGQTVNRNVNDVLTEPQYSDLELVGVQTDYSGAALFGQEGSVTVVVSRPASAEYPQLPEALRQRIAAGTDRSVTVHVRVVENRRATPE